MELKYIWMILLMTIVHCESEKDNINDLVDLVIKGATDSLLMKNNGQINVPDLEEKFHEKIGFVKTSGGLKATEGIFKNLTTLHRTGDAILDLTNNVAKLRLSLGLNTMEIYFNHCRIWVNKLFSMSETLTATIKSNSVEGQISLFDDGENCKATLDHITINELGGLDIKIKVKKGPSFLNKILGKLTTWVVKHYKNHIRQIVEKELYEQVSKEMQKYNICDIFS